MLCLQLPEGGIPIPKHVGVLIITTNCILLSTVVGGCDDDCRNVHGMNNDIKNCSVYTSLRSALGSDQPASWRYVES